MSESKPITDTPADLKDAEVPISSSELAAMRGNVSLAIDLLYRIVVLKEPQAMTDLEGLTTQENEAKDPDLIATLKKHME